MLRTLSVAAGVLLATASVASPASAQLGITLGGGATFSDLSATPPGFTKSSDVGYYVGGSVRFGQFLFVEPGLWYQEQAVELDDGFNSDDVRVRSWLLPIMAGVNFNLQVASIKLGIGPTVTFTSSVGSNDFGFNENQFKGTRWGYQLGGDVRILFINLNLAWQQDFTEAFENQTQFGDGKLSSFRVGVGFGI